MSTAIPYGYLRPFIDDYEPVSRGSKEILEKWMQSRNYLRGSATDWSPTVDAALRDIRSQCHMADWDGQGALPVTDHAISNSEKVIEILYSRLPKGIPAPDVIPEADGEISLSWSSDATHIFALSIGAHDKINFSGQ